LCINTIIGIKVTTNRPFVCALLVIMHTIFCINLRSIHPTLVRCTCAEIDSFYFKILTLVLFSRAVEPNCTFKYMFNTGQINTTFLRSYNNCQKTDQAQICLFAIYLSVIIPGWQLSTFLFLVFCMTFCMTFNKSGKSIHCYKWYIFRLQWIKHNNISHKVLYTRIIVWKK
jgi:hypothetical protein